MMKIFAKEKSTSQTSLTVDTLLKEIRQGIHSDVKGLLRGRLSEIFEMATKEEQKRVDDTRVKVVELETINQEIESLKKKQEEVDQKVVSLMQEQKDIIEEIAVFKKGIKELGDWQKSSNSQSDFRKQKIISLIGLVEPHKVEPGKEISYLMALSEGKNDNYLSTFLVKPQGS